jgi:hypothetical protein
VHIPTKYKLLVSFWISVVGVHTVKAYSMSGGTAPHTSRLAPGERAPAPTEYEVGWAPEPVWTFSTRNKSLAPFWVGLRMQLILLSWVQIGRTAPVLQRGNAGARSVWTSIYSISHHWCTSHEPVVAIHSLSVFRTITKRFCKCSVDVLWCVLKVQRTSFK